MSQIASTILGQLVVRPVSLLGWDGSSSAEVILGNLADHVKRVTGWKNVETAVQDGILIVKCEDGFLLQLRLVDLHELYGRVHHIGLTTGMLMELQSLVSGE